MSGRSPVRSQRVATGSNRKFRKEQKVSNRITWGPNGLWLMLTHKPRSHEGDGQPNKRFLFDRFWGSILRQEVSLPLEAFGSIHPPVIRGLKRVTGWVEATTSRRTEVCDVTGGFSLVLRREASVRGKYAYDLMWGNVEGPNVLILKPEGRLKQPMRDWVQKGVHHIKESSTLPGFISTWGSHKITSKRSTRKETNS